MAVAVGVATHVVITTVLSHCESATYNVVQALLSQIESLYEEVMWHYNQCDSIYTLKDHSTLLLLLSLYMKGGRFIVISMILKLIFRIF